MSKSLFVPWLRFWAYNIITYYCYRWLSKSEKNCPIFHVCVLCLTICLSLYFTLSAFLYFYVILSFLSLNHYYPELQSGKHPGLVVDWLVNWLYEKKHIQILNSWKKTTIKVRFFPLAVHISHKVMKGEDLVVFVC